MYFSDASGNEYAVARRGLLWMFNETSLAGTKVKDILIGYRYALVAMCELANINIRDIKRLEAIVDGYSVTLCRSSAPIAKVCRGHMIDQLVLRARAELDPDCVSEENALQGFGLKSTSSGLKIFNGEHFVEVFVNDWLSYYAGGVNFGGVKSAESVIDYAREALK
jgi:hypothetical protein